MKDYIRIARTDHWIKQLFIIPGFVLALFLTDERTAHPHIVLRLFFGFAGTCLIASANYVINEWLDAPYDRFHPTKKNRPVVTKNLSLKWVIAEYFLLALSGLFLSHLVNRPFFITAAVLLVMGFLYNVKPFRTKDIPFIDVLSESVNNMLRLLMGWFIVTETSIPPSSVLIGYWMAGAFLMATKRFSEYRMINDKVMASLYRRSFHFYTEKSLLASSLFYALISTFCLGVFMVKYRIEYVLATPVMFLLYSYYLSMALDDDSAVQKPEILYTEKKLMILVAVFVLAVTVLTFLDIGILEELKSNALIGISGS